MAKVKFTIIVSTSDAGATSRFAGQHLKEVLEEEFFLDDSEEMESLEVEILEEN